MIELNITDYADPKDSQTVSIQSFKRQVLTEGHYPLKYGVSTDFAGTVTLEWANGSASVTNDTAITTWLDEGAIKITADATGITVPNGTYYVYLLQEESKKELQIEINVAFEGLWIPILGVTPSTTRYEWEEEIDFPASYNANADPDYANYVFYGDLGFDVIKFNYDETVTFFANASGIISLEDSEGNYLWGKKIVMPDGVWHASYHMFPASIVNFYNLGSATILPMPSYYDPSSKGWAINDFRPAIQGESGEVRFFVNLCYNSSDYPDFDFSAFFYAHPILTPIQTTCTVYQYSMATQARTGVTGTIDTSSFTLSDLVALCPVGCYLTIVYPGYYQAHVDISVNYSYLGQNVTYSI